MECLIPSWLSWAAPALPLLARAILVASAVGVARREIPQDAKRVEQHRSLITGLAAFSLAGFALVGAQEKTQFAGPVFDITVSFLCFLSALAIQAWKAYWWHDLLADGFKDAATTSMILFTVRFAFVVGSGFGWARWQFAGIALLGLMAWGLDAVLHFVNSSRAVYSMRGVQRESEEESKRQA